MPVGNGVRDGLFDLNNGYHSALGMVTGGATCDSSNVASPIVEPLTIIGTVSITFLGPVNSI